MSVNPLRPAELFDGLRLHQNENTGGCSPRVLDAISRMARERVGFYPAYAEMERVGAAYLGVPTERVAFTNGLDEGIMALCVASLRSTPGGVAPEVIIPEPTFEIYRLDTDVAGGKVVRVAPRPDYSFPLPAILAAMTPATRLVLLTNPNNPTGQLVPKEDIRTIARQAPAGATVFLDEAYADFARETFLAELESFPNVIIGRTFSKAFGLAGLRIGCLIGAPDRLAPVIRALPVFSVNVCATVALPAALADRAYLEDYLRQVDESKQLIYSACDRLGFKYWKSGGNFVFVKLGDRAAELVGALAARHIYVKDRSREADCAGCVRISAGWVADTQALVTALDEVLCQVPR
ncbi:MAG TPA: histidinol-phosphate transaminase [Vicinamibacterales bacterium]|jgi:histidinol-phosphate aminotransferase